MNIEVIIKTDFEIGSKTYYKYEIHKFARGFCTNYLFKKKLAVLKNKSNLAILQNESKAHEKKKIKIKNMALETANILNGKVLEFVLEVNKEDKVFGSITNKHISEKIFNNFNIKIYRRKISASKIRDVGEHKVIINLHSEVKSEMIVLIKSRDENNVSSS